MMISADVIKEELPEIKQEPEDYQEFTPNIFVKEEESYPEPSRKIQPAKDVRRTVVNGRRYVVYKPKEISQKRYRVNNSQPSRNYNPVNPEPVDPAFFQVPVFRRQPRPKREVVLNPSGLPLLRTVPPRFVNKPAANSQDELERLMNELEEARKKEDTKAKNEKQFPCPIDGCIAIFSSSAGLTRHKLLHKRFLKCPGCEEYFKDKDTLDAHVKTHGLDVQFAYEDLPVVPRTMLLAQAPAKTSPAISSGATATVKIEEHDDADEILNAILQQNAYPCANGNCNATFSTRDLLVEHINLQHCTNSHDGMVVAKEEDQYPM